MTDDLPTVRDSIAFVAAACRPGSLEARVVHHCTCEPIVDRRHNRYAVWNPDQVGAWQSSISLDCPAHGRLLELYIAGLRGLGSADNDNGLAADVRHLGLPPPRAPEPRRSVVLRVVSAIRGWLSSL